MRKKKKKGDDKLGICGRYKNEQAENKKSICNYGDNPRQKMRGCVAT